MVWKKSARLLACVNQPQGKDKKYYGFMKVRFVPNIIGKLGIVPKKTRCLKELEIWERVKNLNQLKLYSRLQYEMLKMSWIEEKEKHCNKI